jgi:hypothetical protein
MTLVVLSFLVILTLYLALRYITEPAPPSRPLPPTPEAPEELERRLLEYEGIRESSPELWSTTPLTEAQLRARREEDEAHRVPMSKRPDYGPMAMVGRPTWEREKE